MVLQDRTVLDWVGNGWVEDLAWLGEGVWAVHLAPLWRVFSYVLLHDIV